MSKISRRALLRSGAVLSTASLLSRSALLEAQQAFAGSAAELPALAPRERLLMDFGWKFFQGNGRDPGKDLGFGNGQGDFSKSGSFAFAQPGFNDTKWRALNLPHDWAVELPFVHDESLNSHGYKPLGRNYPETSVGWYRKSFNLPASDGGRRLRIDFDGAFRSALVFLNGYFIGRNENGYAPFSFDITDYANYGGANALVVRMDASFGDGWFYEGAGIYRHVWLTKMDAVHLGQWDSIVRSDVQGRAATLTLLTTVENQALGAAEGVRVRWEVMDAAGRTVATANAPVTNVPVDGKREFAATARLADATMWSPETPVLYTARAIVEHGGKVVDAEQISFGVRTIRFDVDHGFFLNGRRTLIKGTCNHQDHAGVGAALPDRLQYFRLSVLKEMGGNAVRTSHNMPTPEWVEACDRTGMMMFCETRNEAATPEGLEQMSVMVRRFRNSPSIILWGIGNEEWVLQKDVQGERVAATMIARGHELDPTREWSAAVNGSYGTGISKALEVEGINYNLAAIEPYHASHPKQPLVGSETASTVATRGIYETDKLRNWVSAYDVNFPPWAETAEQWWKFYVEREYLPGGFAWTGFDYRGEPTPYGWPSINSQFGIVDMCGFPKDDFYYYKAWWGAEPVLHLHPHWNWEERLGEPVSVWVHSNVDSVELFLNGTSQGSQKVVANTHLEWKVKYAPGTIEARGTKAGKVILTDKRETTGKVAALHLVADRMTVDADGEDVVVLRVEGRDAQDRLVPNADNRVRFKVTGPGTLIGVGNGDPNCQESDKEPRRSLFNGLAQAIVQTSKAPGAIVIEASSGREGAGLTPATMTLTSRVVTPRLAI